MKKAEKGGSHVDDGKNFAKANPEQSQNNIDVENIQNEEQNTIDEVSDTCAKYDNSDEEYIIAYKDEDMNTKKDFKDLDDPNKSPANTSRTGLIEQSKVTLALKEMKTEKGTETDASPNNHNQVGDKSESLQFFSRELDAFKAEKWTKLSDKKKISTAINFNEMGNEWKSEGNENHWSHKKVKQEGETCSVLFTTIVTGIAFTLIPNCFIVLDYLTAKEYLFGNYYLKYETDEKNISNCRNTSNGGLECLEYDPIYGSLTLLLTFIAGPFWSFGIFIQFGTHLRKIKPEVFEKKRMLFLFFLPLAILCIITFPLQLFIVSLISCFNDQNQWMLLTTKIGITEGMFNAHSQYMLQLFVFFTRADRHPSVFQYMAAFGSLVFLAYSRIESLLLDRGGHHMSPGQKLWWICRYFPGFLFNCSFKVGSISLVIAMLRFNSIWLYGSVLIIWFTLQILFNEQCLPRRHYYLFIGAGLHAVSVAHIPEDIKLVDTHPDSKKNILWATRLTSKQLRFNLLFQNFVWFAFNFIIIVTLTVVSYLEPDIRIPTFWPFTTQTYSFRENKVFRILYIVGPVLLIIGLISQVLLWMFECKTEDKEEIKTNLGLHKKDALDGIRQLSNESEDCECDIGDAVYDGWCHDRVNCAGCQLGTGWHRHVSDDVLQSGVQGTLGRVIYPLMNVWQNVVDKNTA